MRLWLIANSIFLTAGDTDVLVEEGLLGDVMFADQLLLPFDTLLESLEELSLALVELGESFLDIFVSDGVLISVSDM